MLQGLGFGFITSAARWRDCNISCLADPLPSELGVVHNDHVDLFRTDFASRSLACVDLRFEFLAAAAILEWHDAHKGQAEVDNLLAFNAPPALSTACILFPPPAPPASSSSESLSPVSRLRFRSSSSRAFIVSSLWLNATTPSHGHSLSEALKGKHTAERSAHSTRS